MKESILSEKSYKFALRMIKLCKFMNAEHKEYVFIKADIAFGNIYRSKC